MNKQQLITALSDQAGLARVDALHLVNALEQTMHEHAQQGHDMACAGKRQPGSRSGQQPDTCASLPPSARRKVVLLPRPAVKDSLN